MVGASKRFTAESGSRNRNAKRNRFEAGRIGDHFLYGTSGVFTLEFVGRAEREGLRLLGSNRLTSPDGELRCWCVCLGMGAGRGRYGREEVHRPGFPGVPRTPRQLLPRGSVGPAHVMFAPSRTAVPCLFDGDLGCPFQTGEAFYQSPSNLEDLTSASLPSCATRDVTPCNSFAPGSCRARILSMYFLHRHNASHGI